MRRKSSGKKNNAATLGFEEAMLHPADKIRKDMHPSEYKDVPLGLIFLKYISDALEEYVRKLSKSWLIQTANGIQPGTLPLSSSLS